MYISGWGNNLQIKSNTLYPKNINEIIGIIKDYKLKGILVRGMGRSYGDVALNENIISLKYFKRILELDEKDGFLKCSSNVTISEINDLIISKGWFLNITPGSKFVTIGGAIANDVHGKNHHRDGSFSDYIEEFEIIKENGEVVSCSNEINSEMFHATCGGLGLTGIITNVKIKLLKINSKNIDVKIVKTNNFEQTIQKLNDLKDYKYLVAWTDTLSKKNNGRSIIFCGEHSNDGDLNYKKQKSFKIPGLFGFFLLNSIFVKMFNLFYYLFHKNNQKLKKDINNFFYPLDTVNSWNKLYGKDGFTQVQILIKQNKNNKDLLEEIINYFSEKGFYSYLTTLKEYGEGNRNLLSFGEKGLSITLDIALGANFSDVYKNFEKRFSNENIKIYLAKDSFMSKTFFKNTYSNLNNFIEFQKKVNPNSTFKSKLSKRLGL